MFDIYTQLRSIYNLFKFDHKIYWDKLALKYLPADGTILDVGCGEGRFISHDPQRIVGVDHNPKSVGVCKSKGFSVRKGDITNLPFRDGQFNAVHCSQVIEYLYPRQLHTALKELSRILRKGGILILRAPLLHEGFYYELSHIRPYYPEAILHYYTPANQRNLPDLGAESKY